ncbi:CAAX amino protease [Acidocella aquatica]|uniref:CAAX amino protease n=1 Tax=Acidocella aquatica TaxID=1922313 RepID=A0ABQ6AEH0_9PROT|nr:CAAX amino protease [Acidocella aquatica]
MKAGWRAAIFVALGVVQLGVVMALLAIAIRHTGDSGLIVGGRYTPLFIGLNELALLLPALGATGAMAFLEDVPFTAYGLGGAGRGRLVALGLACGVAALGLLALALLASGHGVAVSGGIGWVAGIGYGAAWLAVSLLTGVAEELAFRGYLLTALARGTGFWPAAGLTSLLFCVLHGLNAGESAIGMADIFGAGLVLALGIRLTGSLWWSIGFHGGWDYAENYLFGTHDSGASCLGTLLDFTPRGAAYLSGGATGPEGSLFSLGVLALAGAGLWFSRGRLAR